MSEKIECSFSLLDTKRKYTGQHRKYVIENARNICYSPITREKLEKREAYGFYGHGRRILCGKMDIQEVDVITLPDGGQAMVSNIPSNVTVKFEIDNNGTVSHIQEILDTETGKIVSSLNASKVGGFSWACPGKDGGAMTTTILTGFSGFDYVLAPGFSSNRGYILESARRDAILESVAAITGDDRKAEQLVAGWQLQDMDISSWEDAVFESRDAYFKLKEQNEDLIARLASYEKKSLASESEMANLKDSYRSTLMEFVEALPVFIPSSAMEFLMEGDFNRARGILESAKRIDFSQYPLSREKGIVKKQARIKIRESDEPAYGTTAYGFNLDL